MNSILSAFKYILDTTPGPQFKFYTPLYMISGVLFVSAIAFSLLYKKRKEKDFAFKRIFKNTGKNLFWIGFLFLFLTITRYENIPYFSMRLLLFLNFVLLAYFLYKTIYNFKVIYPKERQNVIEKLSKAGESKNKYLPHKKKK